MQVIYKSVLAFKNCQTVFRSHSSGALPVLAITGFHFCCKTNGKPYILAPTGVPKQSLFWGLWAGPLGSLWDGLLGPLWELSGELFCDLLTGFSGSSPGFLWAPDLFGFWEPLARAARSRAERGSAQRMKLLFALSL